MSDQHITAVLVSFSGRFGHCPQPRQSFTIATKHEAYGIAVRLPGFNGIGYCGASRRILVDKMRKRVSARQMPSCMMASDVEPLFKLIYVFVGALASALFTQDSPSAIDKIKRLFPNLADHVYVRIDFVLVLLAATALAYAYDPLDPGRAVIGGFGSVALVKQFFGKRPNRNAKKVAR
jgi:hypothetical protein